MGVTQETKTVYEKDQQKVGLFSPSFFEQNDSMGCGIDVCVWNRWGSLPLVMGSPGRLTCV